MIEPSDTVCDLIALRLTAFLELFGEVEKRGFRRREELILHL